MATKKIAAKPAAKKAPAKAPAAKNVKQPTVAKNQAKAAPKKVVKPVTKPAAKVVAKPVTKKLAVKTPVVKAVKSPVTKTPAKKAVAPVKKAAAPAKVSKPVASPATKKTVPAPQPAALPMAKKTEDKKTTAKSPAKPAPIKSNASAKNPKDIKIAPAKPVVIPKTNTKTARTYKPEFTKSVLDPAKADTSSSIVRYSDSDLTEFRELIQRKLGAAKKEWNYLQGLITRKDEMGGDEGDNRYMTMEDGSLSMEREQLSQMASRQVTFIDHLEKALMRIENKTYGICRVTGKLIDKARLRAVPHATLSIEAKMGQR